MSEKITVGWREFCALPTLNIPAIKAKIDTGARTSALYAANIETFQTDGAKYVKFVVHPDQNHYSIEVACSAKIFEQRYIRNSGGQQELRYVIKTKLQMGDQEHDIELSLSNREDMRFRMLLGREALKLFGTVDPELSFSLGHYNSRQLARLYSSSIGQT